MDIKFDERGTFLGIPKEFFDIANRYTPKKDKNSNVINLKDVLDDVKEYPWTSNKLSEHPFYKYPDYQYAVLSYIANFAEKNAYKTTSPADEIFNIILTKYLSFIEKHGNDTIGAYDENGNIAIGVGKLRNLCKNVLVHQIIPFDKNLQRDQSNQAKNEKRSYINPNMTSLDQPISNDISDDTERTIGDTVKTTDYSYENKEFISSLETVRDSFQKESDEWKIADWLVTNFNKGINDIKHEWHDIAQQLGYPDATNSTFRRKRENVYNKIKKNL